ncbi:hypothetical protein EVG20_g7519 [Dentipellis fragilis]|uniref:Uncharacterized protein n=1 Tax=Dentipellis fragilis TaxID=205917 RepID=A0A4Y9YD93_9AGAM|nr:hypothetical protein EVG20_g7519 [Dentipellis fragilis]
MSDFSVTSQPHTDFVGDDTNINNVPGATKAATGHHYTAAQPTNMPENAHHGRQAAQERPTTQMPLERRPSEHLPPPTGRDNAPKNDLPPLGSNIRSVIAGDQHPTPPPDMPGLPPISTPVFDPDASATPTHAVDTLGGATSADVAQPWQTGHPGGGMSSAEMHHDGLPHRKRRGQGTEQYGEHGGEFNV